MSSAKRPSTLAEAGRARESLWLLELQGGQSWPLAAGRHVLGSAEHCDVLIAAADIAPEHLVLTVAPARLYCQARPEQSFSLQGKPDQQASVLEDGQRLDIGAQCFIVRRQNEKQSTAEVVHRLGEQATFSTRLDALRESGADSSSELALLYKLADLVGVADQKQAFADQLLSTLLDVIPGQRAFLMLFGSTSQTTDCLSVPKVAGQPSQTALDRVRKRHVSLLTTDASADPRLLDSTSIAANAIRIALCAPLIDGQQVFGALYLDGSQAERLPDARDLALLESVASYCSVALSRVRANQVLRQRELHTHLLVHDLKNPAANVITAMHVAKEMLESLGDSLSEESRHLLEEMLDISQIAAQPL
jgi:GAF domain-containing protein